MSVVSTGVVARNGVHGHGRNHGVHNDDNGRCCNCVPVLGGAALCNWLL